MLIEKVYKALWKKTINKFNTEMEKSVEQTQNSQIEAFLDGATINFTQKSSITQCFVLKRYLPPIEEDDDSWYYDHQPL